MTTPARASSFWGELRCIRGPQGPARLRELRDILAANRAQAEERRSRVLAHEWSRARLKHILDLSEASKWNGYIPAKTQDARHGEIVTTSRIRQPLIQLLHDVKRFEETGQLPVHADPDAEQLALPAAEA